MSTQKHHQPAEPIESPLASLRSDVEAIIGLVDAMRNVPGTVPRCSLDPLREKAEAALEKMKALAEKTPRLKG